MDDPYHNRTKVRPKDALDISESSSGSFNSDFSEDTSSEDMASSSSPHTNLSNLSNSSFRYRNAFIKNSFPIIVKDRKGRIKRVNSLCSKIKDKNWKKYRPGRAGGIPYTIVNGRILFCLGLDSKHKEWTDFGGGVKQKTETPIMGGLRELHEESLEIFDIPKHTDENYSEPIQNELVVASRNIMIMFIKVDLDREEMYNKIRIFNRRLRFERNPEVCEISWFTEREFQSLIDGEYIEGYLYNRVKKVLKSSDIIYKIKSTM